MDPWAEAMRHGDFATAWAISDAVLAREATRAQCPTRPRHLQIVWDGRPLDGKRVLVRCYHGLGDTVQFVRLLPLLRARAAHVALWAQPALLGLLRGCGGCDSLHALHDGDPQIERDADVELIELPHILRLSPERIPRRVPYLRVDGACVAHTHPRIGLAWRAGDWDASRSIDAAVLQPLAELRGVEWVSLQYGASSTPWPMASIACADLHEQARRMLTLDLVISVDTLFAHLAGALGIEVWTLLPAPCDWRWMHARSDSPWYPTMRLFRQHVPGEWLGAIEQVRRLLVQRSRERTPSAGAKHDVATAAPPWHGVC